MLDNHKINRIVIPILTAERRKNDFYDTWLYFLPRLILFNFCAGIFGEKWSDERVKNWNKL